MNREEKPFHSRFFLVSIVLIFPMMALGLCLYIDGFFEFSPGELIMIVLGGFKLVLLVIYHMSGGDPDNKDLLLAQ